MLVGKVSRLIQIPRPVGLVCLAPKARNHLQPGATPQDLLKKISSAEGAFDARL